LRLRKLGEYSKEDLRPSPLLTGKDLIGMGSVSSVLLFVTGALYFRRKERIFADVA